MIARLAAAQEQKTMYLYFIRHGKPDYATDTLLPEGIEQAAGVLPGGVLQGPGAIQIDDDGLM